MLQNKENTEAQSALDTLLNDVYLVVEEAAAIVSVHPETIRRWCRKGILPHFQAGPKKQYRIPISTLLPFKKRRLLPGTPVLPAKWFRQKTNLPHDVALHN